MPVDANTPVPDPNSSYLEELTDCHFMSLLFYDETFRDLLARLRKSPDLPPRLLTFMAANFSYARIPVGLKHEVVAQSRVCMDACRNDSGIADELRNLLAILERVNRVNYGHYLKDGTHMLIEKLERCESYVRLNHVFCDHMYQYACYASPDQVGQAFSVALTRGRAFLAQKPRLTPHETSLAICVDQYDAVVANRIPWPVPYVSSVFWNQHWDLPEYPWLHAFLYNIRSESTVNLYFLFLETGLLAHRHILPAQG